MRGDPSALELVVAGSLDEACARVAEGYRPFAGGTDVMVLLSAGKLAHARWVDLSRIPELARIEVSDEAIVFGALTTYTDVRRHPVASRELPMLAQAARETGGIAIQNRGTLGGNVANASPAADSPPALLAYDATIELVSPAGARRVPYATFHTGYKRTVAEPWELIARILVPRHAGRTSYYRKVGPRRAQAISKVCFAGCVERAEGKPTHLRMAFGGVAPVPIRALDAERAVLAGAPVDEVNAALARAVVPIDDIRSTARYRRRVAENLVGEFLAHVGLAR